MPLKALIKKARDFRRDTRGTVAVETVIMWPGLFLAMLAMAVLFDAYRARSTTDKAAFAISDMLSRETAAVTFDYLDGARSLFSEISSVRSDHDLIVSLVTWDTVNDTHRLGWSHSITEDGAEDTLAWDNTDMINMSDNLPTLVDGESIVVVQTNSTFVPPTILRRWWGDNWDGVALNTLVFSRPRFVSNLAWSDA
ncbi:TadE/TadG family type IV pilus assembly protein [Shimia sp.]|uniref:TadE/TadG family type IV pilus assembly protein n=1 Tax=Shimia sp. TaxID=1954381 RepID=UPI003B8C3EB4